MTIPGKNIMINGVIVFYNNLDTITINIVTLIAMPFLFTMTITINNLEFTYNEYTHELGVYTVTHIMCTNEHRIYVHIACAHKPGVYT